MNKVFTILLALSAICSYGQNVRTYDLKVPHMGQHIFTQLEHPTFVSTYVSNDLGIGFNSPYDIPVFQFGEDSILSLDGSLLYVTLNIEYEQRVREWMGLVIQVGLNGRVGTGVATLLTHGVTSINYSSLGWLVRFFENRKWYLSGYFELERTSGNIINIKQFVDEILSETPNPSINEQVQSLTTSVRLNAIHVFTDFLALVVNGGVGLGDHFTENKDAMIYLVHGAADINFINRWNLPIGFYLGYELTNRPELIQVPDEGSNIFFYKLNYTGSNDFNFTLEGNTTISPILGVNEKVTFTNMVFSVRVFF